jgi:hypothetical protein
VLSDYEGKWAICTVDNPPIECDTESVGRFGDGRRVGLEKSIRGCILSRYNTVQTEYKDSECLVEALGDMGYTEVEVHETAQTLYGYHDDARKEKAHIIIRRKYVGASANDLGFLRNADGSYSQIVSDFDRGKHDAKWNVALKVAYGDRGAMKVARKKGFKFLGKVVENGKTRLKFLDPRSN